MRFILVVALVGCGGQAKPDSAPDPAPAPVALKPADKAPLAPRDPRDHVHAGEFEVVFERVAKVVSDRFEMTNLDANERRVSTNWHPVDGRDGDDGTKYFIRFVVLLLESESPPGWRVDVVAHAASWTAGTAVPQQLSDRPIWLDGEIVKLERAIFAELSPSP